MTDLFLHRLLDQSLHHHPEYRGGLSSHLPMALHALRGLGADDARLAAFFDHYAPRLRSDEPAHAGPLPADWRALRGLPNAWPALREHFAAAVRAQGAEAVLRGVLPDLWPGVAAAAFHGLIRTAHAVETGHSGELAAALAYWAWRWQPVAPPDAGGPMAFDDWAAALRERAAGWHSGQGLISGRVAEAQQSAAYRSLAGRLPWQHDTLHRLSAFSARRYAQTRHFTVLHLVTACRAARVLWPFVADAPAAATSLVHAFTAAYVTCGLPAGDLAVLEDDRPTTTQALAPAACASDDDHVIKLVHACQAHEAAYGPGPWRAAAARALTSLHRPQLTTAPPARTAPAARP